MTRFRWLIVYLAWGLLGGFLLVILSGQDLPDGLYLLLTCLISVFWPLVLYPVWAGSYFIAAGLGGVVDFDVLTYVLVGIVGGVLASLQLWMIVSLVRLIFGSHRRPSGGGKSKSL